jgi:flagellar protein FliS
MFGSAFGSAKKGASAYATLGVETGVGFASPHRLIVMLFDGALAQISTGLIEMRSGNVAAKGHAISRAITIVGEGLRASLNKDVGGEIAHSLDALYLYIESRMLQANLHNEPEHLLEAQRLLTELRDAWLQIDPEQSQATASVPAAARMAAQSYA